MTKIEAAKLIKELNAEKIPFDHNANAITQANCNGFNHAIEIAAYKVAKMASETSDGESK